MSERAREAYLHSDPDRRLCTCGISTNLGKHYVDPNCPTHGTARALTLEYGDPTMPEHICEEHQAATAACEHLHREAELRAEERVSSPDGSTTGKDHYGHGCSLDPATVAPIRVTNDAPLPQPFQLTLTTASHAGQICREAAELVNGPRNVDYGDALDNFSETAALWTTVLGPVLREGAQISAEQVALCLDQVKTARLIHNLDHRDSWVDKVGYSALGGGIARRRETDQ